MQGNTEGRNTEARTCSVCRQPIEENAPTIAYRRTLKDANEYAHQACAESDMLARLRVMTVYGVRGARAICR